MKGHRARTVRCMYSDCEYINPEGYDDPTAGHAIDGIGEIYAAPLIRDPKEKEIVVFRKIPSVSELEAFIKEDMLTGKSKDRWPRPTSWERMD